MAEQFADIMNGGLSSIWFFSGFFTSVWLWLYEASVMVSRVIITSAIFTLGLPLVLL